MAYLSEVSAYGSCVDDQGKHMNDPDGFDFTIILEKHDFALFDLKSTDDARIVVRVDKHGQFEDMVFQVLSDNEYTTLSLDDSQTVACISIIEAFRLDTVVIADNIFDAICEISVNQPFQDIVFFVSDFFDEVTSVYNGYSASVFYDGKRAITMSMDFVNDTYTGWHSCNNVDKSVADMLVAKYSMIDANSMQSVGNIDMLVQSVFGKDRDEYIKQVHDMSECNDMPIAPLFYGQVEFDKKSNLKSIRSDLNKIC